MINKTLELVFFMNVDKNKSYNLPICICAANFCKPSRPTVENLLHHLFALMQLFLYYSEALDDVVYSHYQGYRWCRAKVRQQRELQPPHLSRLKSRESHYEIEIPPLSL